MKKIASWKTFEFALLKHTIKAIKALKQNYHTGLLCRYKLFLSRSLDRRTQTKHWNQRVTSVHGLLIHLNLDFVFAIFVPPSHVTAHISHLFLCRLLRSLIHVGGPVELAERDLCLVCVSGKNT